MPVVTGTTSGRIIGTRAALTAKQKKSYTLSRSSVRFLERLTKETEAPSVSFILDTLIRQAEEQHRRVAIDQAVSDYYSNLSDEDERELSAWAASPWSR